MEDILHLYNLPLDEKRPVICFDELPVQLLGEVAVPLPMKKGEPQRVDYEYERGGTCSLLVAFEPLTGNRLVETSKLKNESRLLPLHAASDSHVPERGKARLGARQLEHASREFLLRELAASRSLRVSPTLRDALHAEERFLAQHGGVGVIGTLAHLFGTAHPVNRGTRPGDTIVGL